MSERKVVRTLEVVGDRGKVGGNWEYIQKRFEEKNGGYMYYCLLGIEACAYPVGTRMEIAIIEPSEDKGNRNESI